MRTLVLTLYCVAVFELGISTQCSKCWKLVDRDEVHITAASDSTLRCCLHDLDKKTFDVNQLIIVEYSNVSLETFVKEISNHTDDLKTVTMTLISPPDEGEACLSVESGVILNMLFFEESSLHEVPRDAFGEFKNIDKLSLDGNGISTLVPHSFYNLTKLRQLDLSNNSITSIPKWAFYELPALVKIKLFMNKIVSFHPEAFFKIPDLRHAIFQENHITTIDFTMFGHSSNLVELDLSYNRITRINVDVTHICHVRELYLHHNELTYVSPNSSCMINLKELNLSHNNLTTLPEQLGALFRRKTETPIITNNPWKCDCQIRWLIDIAIQMSTADQVTCANPPNTTMQYFNDTELPCDRPPLGPNGGETQFNTTTMYLVLLSCLGGLCVVCIVTSVICMWRRRRRSHLSPHAMTSVSITPLQQSPCSMVANSNYNRLYSHSSTVSSSGSTYMDNSVLKVGKLLGSGAFGEVYEGYSGDIENGQKKVAIKMIRENSSIQEASALEQEFKQLTQIDNHPHIIQVFSTGKIDGSFVMVMEMAEYGDLLTYLKKISDSEELLINSLDSAEEKYYLLNNQPRLFSFMLDVARGMEYLSQLKILHRDLAARNILLCSGPVAKIADFGLSRDVYESGYYYQDIQGRLPYKWLSPETLLSGRSTLKSDVWSFGILMWEIVTLGGNPYPGILPGMLIDMYKNGYIMPQPNLCPDNVYSIMTRSWDHCIETRPEFTYIVDALDSYIQSRTTMECRTEPEEMVQLLPGRD